MLQNLGKTDLCPIFYLCVSYLSTAKCEPAEEKNPPINLLSSGFSNLTVQVHRNLPLHQSTVVCFTNSRNPHLSLFRTSAGIVLTRNNNQRLLNTKAMKLSAPWEDRTADLGISPTYKYHALTNCANGAQLPVSP
uniref:Secreted protein n=1 Tax=Heterorhabditis bacteriophora TaxID=37862 RepID=A0A1I7W6W7_HETBA